MRQLNKVYWPHNTSLPAKQYDQATKWLEENAQGLKFPAWLVTSAGSDDRYWFNNKDLHLMFVLKFKT